MNYDKIISNFALNNINCLIADDQVKVMEYLDEMINEHDVVGYGGSMTLQELQIIDYLKNRDLDLLDRNKDSDVAKLYRDVFSSDVYLASANAIINDGSIYNVDGIGNRVAAMVFGPKKVILIVGENKIVSSYEQGVERVKKIAAPLNAKRLKRNTPCVEVGECVNCRSAERICCSEVLIKYQREKNRITVIIVKGQYGY